MQFKEGLQERMKWEGDGPAYIKALEFIAKGRLLIDGEALYLYDKNFHCHEPLPYCGYRILN